MFRAKITLTFVVLALLLCGGVYFILHGQIQDALVQDAEIALRRAATIEGQAMRLNEFALIEKAQFTAEDKELYRVMRIGQDPLLYEQLHPKYPAAQTPEGVRHVAVYDAPLSVDKLRLETAAKAASATRNLERDLYARSPAVPDLFMVLDQNGKAVAALGKGRRRWWRHNIATQFPIVLEAVQKNTTKTAIWNWAWNEADTVELYRVAIVPIRPSPDQQAVGVVVTGNIISDGLATRNQRLLAGITSSGDTLKDIERGVLESAPQVAFFQGDHLVGSTFSSSGQDALQEAVFADANILDSDSPEQLVALKVAGEPYMAIVRFFAGEFDTSKNPAGFIVLSPLAEARQPVVLATTNIIAITAAIVLVGLILLLFFIHAFIKPISTIEQGLGEILAGNKDYVFEVENAHSTFSNMSQGLNLVSAFLQGKPMPDDPDGHGDWSEWMSDDSGSTGTASPGKVTGVAMPGRASAPKPKNPDEPDGDA